MALLQTTLTNISAPLTIVGKDLEAGATFNADVTLGAGKLRAGTLMKYDTGTQALAKATVTGGTPDAVFGVLADEFDDTGAATPIPAMVYRKGVFLRQEIESANNVALVPGGAIDILLRDLGILLEQSYPGYVGLSPVPSGVVPLSEISEQEVAKYETTPLGPEGKPIEPSGEVTEPLPSPAPPPPQP